MSAQRFAFLFVEARVLRRRTGSAVVALWLLVAGVLRLRRALVTRPSVSGGTTRSVDCCAHLVVTVGLGLGRTLAVTVRLALRGVSVVALWRRTVDG